MKNCISKYYNPIINKYVHVLNLKDEKVIKPHTLEVYLEKIIKCKISVTDENLIKLKAEDYTYGTLMIMFEKDDYVVFNSKGSINLMRQATSELNEFLEEWILISE